QGCCVIANRAQCEFNARERSRRHVFFCTRCARRRGRGRPGLLLPHRKFNIASTAAMHGFTSETSPKAVVAAPVCAVRLGGKANQSVWVRARGGRAIRRAVLRRSAKQAADVLKRAHSHPGASFV